MPKNALRRELLARRSALTSDEWRLSSQAAQQQLLGLLPYQAAQRVALYAPLKNEVDTAGLFAEACASGKQTLYPLVCGDSLRFHQVSSDEQLKSGSFGILEPCPLRCRELAEPLDLMVVPGVAFDLLGHRIGYGKGYYDRYLSRLFRMPLLIGLCHDFQLRDQVPAERHDIRMDYVVTASRVIKIAVTDR